MAQVPSPARRLPVGRCLACRGQNRRIEDLPSLLGFLLEEGPECLCPDCGRSLVTLGPELTGFLQHLEAALGQARVH